MRTPLETTMSHDYKNLTELSPAVYKLAGNS
jgi:hypothetical protein